MKVAIQGQHGSYHEAATEHYFGKDTTIELVCCDTFADVFAKAGANLTKLESRPVAHTPWRYQFLIDVQTTLDQLAACVKQLEFQACTVRILGQYNTSHETFA